MVQTPSKALTIEEFLQLPETKPASEYINGQIIPKPMPQGEHSVIQADLVAAITLLLSLKRLRGLCLSYAAPLADERSFLTLLCLPTTGFLEKLTELSQITSRSPQIGQLKFCRLINVRRG
jgi:hypothetical protein